MTVRSIITRYHALFWSLLYCPFGIITGFFTVTFIFKISRDGFSASQIALILAAPSLINWLRWLWAPIVDTCRRMRPLYLGANSIAVLMLIFCLARPARIENLSILILMVFIAGFCNSITGMVVEASVAKIAGRGAMKQACAWMQAGGLIGSGLGGALGLLALTSFETHPLFAGYLLASVSVLCSFAIFAVPINNAQTSSKPFLSTLREITVEVRGILASSKGLLAAILCALPLGTGVAQAILTQAKAAALWHVSAGQIALIQGLFVGLLTPLGSILSANLFKRIKPTQVYALSGFALAVITYAMSLSSFTAFNYCVYNLLYALFMGLAYGAFSAMIISLVGKKSAASGYNVFASFANFPIWAMNLILAWAVDAYSVGTMLMLESLVGGLSFIIFVLAQSRLAPSSPISDALAPKHA